MPMIFSIRLVMTSRTSRRRWLASLALSGLLMLLGACSDKGDDGLTDGGQPDGGTVDGGPPGDAEAPGDSTEPTADLVLTTREDVEAYTNGERYFLDANNGDDLTGDGSSGNPWRTIAKSQASCPEGSIIVLRSGSYGVFTDDAYTSSRTSWTLYINEEGATPVLNRVSLSGGQGHDLRLIFYGIKIAPEWVDPGPLAPYNRSLSPVGIHEANYIRFYHCELVGTNKYLTSEAAYLSYAENIHFERCHVHKVAEGIVYIYSSHITMYYNYVHEVCACFFKDGWEGSSYITIEGNHAHDAGYSTADQYGEDAAYHGSMIAVNNATTTIRNNVLHDGGGTNGICFYTDGDPVYRDVLIENNLVYNPTATTCVDVEQVAENVVIRNNIFVGKKRNEDLEEYMYNNAIYVGEFASGHDGSGLSIYNNVFVGRAAIVPDTTFADIDYNIAYHGDDIETLHSIVALSIPDPGFFESGFFNGPLDLEYESTPDQILDLTFAGNSPGINFGDPENQPLDSLGHLHPSGFLIPSGPARDDSHHSAGCYEVD